MTTDTKAAVAAALMQAADVDWATGRNITDDAPAYLTDWQRGLVAGQKAYRDAILALIPADAMAALEAVKAEAVAMRDFEIATLHRQISEAQSALEGLCRAHGMPEHRGDCMSWLDETIGGAMEGKQ